MASEDAATSTTTTADEEKLHELVYFDLAGKGEPIRLAFTIAGIPFVDTRLVSERIRNF